MTILAIDTAANLCAVCLWDAHAKKSLAFRSVDLGRGHAEHLLSLLQSVLDEAELQMSDVTKVGVSVGPGSFTGIRVGVAAARGFGVALGIPIIGLSVFEALSAQIHSQIDVAGAYAIAVNGGRGQAFVQQFDMHGNQISAPEILLLDASHEKPLANAEHIYGNAATAIDAARAMTEFKLATADIQTYAALTSAGNAPPKPLYIRSADAKKNEGFALPRREANTL